MDVHKKREITERIRLECDDLRQKSTACRMLGLKELAASLYRDAYNIEEAVKELDGLIDADLDERFQDAQHGTGAILNALAAGAKLGDKVDVLPNTLEAKS